MTRRTSSRTLGIFMTLGIVIAVAAVIWVGASKFFEKGERYVTYFDESVQGLQRDSSVKYRGVDVGRVEEIRVAPDNRLIEIVMKIRLREEVEKNSVASLRVAGITGIVFIELDLRDPEAPDLSPKIDFAAPYPIIPSKPSIIRQIFSNIDDIVEKIRQVDLNELSQSVTRSAKAAEHLLSGPQTRSILNHLEAASADLNRTAAKVEAIAAGGDLDRIVSETRSALEDARSLIASTRDELKALRLRETAEKTNRMVDSLSRSSRTTARDLQAMAENLRRASERLEALMERLEARPSDLIFSGGTNEGKR